MVATLDDYAVVRDLTGDLFAEALDGAVKPETREVVALVRDLNETREDKGAGVTELAAKLGFVVTLFALGVDEELIDRNPFRGLVRKPAGRADQPPPTDAELTQLLDLCDVHGDYGYRVKAMLAFCAFLGGGGGPLYGLYRARLRPPCGG